MRKFFLIIILSFVLLPMSVFAECKKEGVTVVYVNGIFTSEIEAKKDLNRLRYEYQKLYNDNVTFLTGYNATHLGGLGDLIKSVQQAYGITGLDTDLIKILEQVHSELSTRKVLLVGHSQGTFYTNLAYDYLINNGVSQESIAVYNVATPADRVAGEGKYLTSDTDKVINSIVRDLANKSSARKPLPANSSIKLTPSEEADKYGGHSLGQVYLSSEGERILGEMNQAIAKLTSEQDVVECFQKPKISLKQKTATIALALGDGMASLIKVGIGVVSRTLAFWAKHPEIFIAGGFGNTPKTAETLESLSSSTNIIIGNLVNLNVLAFDQKQDEIDDFLEKLDSMPKGIDEVNETPVKLSVSDDRQTTQATALASVSSGGRTIFPTVLISEVQIASATDSKEEFIELYNPNDAQVELTNWYLQRKTKGADTWSTFAPTSFFTNHKIPPHGFLLIARQDYFSDLADIFVANALTEDNALALKSPSGEIIDKIGWGTAPDFETAPTFLPASGQSLGRSDQEIDTQNNFKDFFLNTPTPKKINVLYQEPEEIKPEDPLKNILINEIQIDSALGTGGVNDDWVELYNPNDKDVVLKDWSIQKHSKDNPCSPAKSFYRKNFDAHAKIKAHGFFLIVSTKANDELKSLADMTASWSLSDNNTVYLVNPDGAFVDQVAFGTDSCFAETAPASAIPDGTSIERKKLGQDADNNSEDFKISDEVTPGETFPKTNIFDETDYSLHLATNNIGAPFYDLRLRWQSNALDIESYQVQYRMNEGEFVDWLTTTETQKYFRAFYSLLSENVYTFRVRAKDKNGVEGGWSKELVIDLRIPIIINEVAYAGTDGDPDNQWIELYNKTNQDIDLNGWKIVVSENFTISLTGKIGAKSYFLLAKNTNIAENISAHQTFDESLGQHFLYLRAPSGLYVDEFYAGQFGFDQNLFLRNGQRYSMERVSEASLGMLDKNWLLARAETLGGTPGARNSVNGLYTYYNFGFTEDTLLPKTFSPYLFAGQNMILLPNKKLTIEPGVVIKFYDNKTKLEINGTLSAIGSLDAPIVFTSFLDDEYGGDSNRDVGATIPRPGDWLSLYFSPESQNSQLGNVRVRFAGAVLGSQPFAWGNALWVDGTDITLKNSILEKNRNRALVLANSNSVVDTVSFLENNITDWPFEGQSMGVWIEGLAPEITNSYFEKNDTGIFISDGFDLEKRVRIPATPIVQNNTFIKNNIPVVLNNPANAIFSSNQATDNSYNAILLPQVISQDLSLKPDLPYLVRNIVVLRGEKVLTLAPGTHIKFQNERAGFEINGSLWAQGTPDAPIYFEPYFSDSRPASWLGLRFTPTSQNSELENVVIDRAGSRQDNAYLAGIKVENTSISLKNSQLVNNSNRGVWLQNSTSQIEGLIFDGQNTTNLSLEARALHIQGTSPEIKNSIFKNNYYGIYQEDFKNEATGEIVPFAPILQNNQFENNIIDIFPLATP